MGLIAKMGGSEFGVGVKAGVDSLNIPNSSHFGKLGLGSYEYYSTSILKPETYDRNEIVEKNIKGEETLLTEPS